MEQISEPNKPIGKDTRDTGRKVLDAFSDVTGLRGSRRDQLYAETVRRVIPDNYIAESSQFALCIRTSSTSQEQKDAAIGLRCTEALDLLPSASKEETGRLPFSEVWKGLVDLIEQLQIPNINFSNDMVKNAWRKATNFVTGSKDKFNEKQATFDERFAEYVKAMSTAVSLSYVKKNGISVEQMMAFLRFGAASGDGTIGGATSVTMGGISKTNWPGKYQPSMGSRYLLCFGRLAHGKSSQVVPQELQDQCTGFWNKDMARDAIQSIGESLSYDKWSIFRDRTLYHVRMEILYGKSQVSAAESGFGLVGGAFLPNAKGLAKTIAKLVRERVAKDGLTCDL